MFARLGTAELYACLQDWGQTLSKALTDHGIQLDGTTLRHSFDTASGKAALHVVNAWSTDLQACLSQVAVDGDSNEITAAPKLLEMLELTGAVVTVDAMHCQKETAQAIRDKGVDSLLTVKGNQPAIQKQVQKLFEDAGEREVRDMDFIVSPVATRFHRVCHAIMSPRSCPWPPA